MIILFYHHNNHCTTQPWSCRGEFFILLYNDKVLGVVGDFRPLFFFMNSFPAVLSILRMLRWEVVFRSLGERSARALASLNF
jgi:hypothetical protein